ncbi:reverse transcriptase family protein [Paludisphaera rhizosphaerae]|uniref:reverse transcriptase family protein n=1 Tax=Paludisphaera rhizosphaerae TaxID=2711216 RepID=UPI0013EA62F8|nr:reverse transcriptase family protein [Paludisphaera rhizosphaerae]
MLNVRSERCLADILGVTVHALKVDLGRLNRDVREFQLIDPARPDKVREVIQIVGAWRRHLDRLMERLLLPRITPSIHNHGGVKGRSIFTNASAHAENVYVYTADVRDFFPSIHHRRVYRLFFGRFGCSPDVASICTRLCTHNYHLAVGLPSSPLLADQAMREVDERIHGACQSAGLTYTRFVDDLTISGGFDFAGSGFLKLLPRILEKHGFRLNPRKIEIGRLDDGPQVTKLWVNRGRPDVAREFIQRLMEQMEDAERLANGGDFVGPYFTPDQIYGRVCFVRSIRWGRGRDLMRRYRSVQWSKVEAEAGRLGLVAERKRLIPKPKEEAG